MSRTVRDVAFDTLRRLDLTTLFANPGSTEVPLLSGLPADLEFVLALHEGSVIAMAAGHALGRGAPSLALVHSTPGLGNAVGALASARQNRAPLVVLVGQQDRRHLAQAPFLAGELAGLAGDYPVWSTLPVRPQDVPGAIVRAYHEALTGRGPAVVVVPMDDWAAPAPEPHELVGPRELQRGGLPFAENVSALADLLATAERPVLVAGAGNDSEAGWTGLVALAERLGAPVWQEPFGGAAGFPQDHPRFAGHLPASRARVRDTLASHDAVLVVGTGFLRQYPYVPGPLVAPGTAVAVVSADPADVHRSPVDLGVLADPAAVCHALAHELDPEYLGLGDAASSRPAPEPSAPLRTPPDPPAPPAPGAPLRAGHVLAALAERLDPETALVEEAPSNRPELHARLPIRRPGGFTSAMGLLGFGLPAAIGLRLAQPGRPVVAVLGDGATIYQVQGLWSAARYGAGVLFVVLANGGYAIMDRLAERAGAAGPWPSLEGVSISGLAAAQGVEAEVVGDHATLLARLDAILPTLATRTTPLVLEVTVEADPTFDA